MAQALSSHLIIHLLSDTPGRCCLSVLCPTRLWSHQNPRKNPMTVAHPTWVPLHVSISPHSLHLQHPAVPVTALSFPRGPSTQPTGCFWGETSRSSEAYRAIAWGRWCFGLLPCRGSGQLPRKARGNSTSVHNPTVMLLLSRGTKTQQKLLIPVKKRKKRKTQTNKKHNTPLKLQPLRHRSHPGTASPAGEDMRIQPLSYPS